VEEWEALCLNALPSQHFRAGSVDPTIVLTR